MTNLRFRRRQACRRSKGLDSWSAPAASGLASASHRARSSTSRRRQQRHGTAAHGGSCRSRSYRSRRRLRLRNGHRSRALSARRDLQAYAPGPAYQNGNIRTGRRPCHRARLPMKRRPKSPAASARMLRSQLGSPLSDGQAADSARADAVRPLAREAAAVMPTQKTCAQKCASVRCHKMRLHRAAERERPSARLFVKAGFDNFGRQSSPGEIEVPANRDNRAAVIKAGRENTRRANQSKSLSTRSCQVPARSR